MRTIDPPGTIAEPAGAAAARRAIPVRTLVEAIAGALREGLPTWFWIEGEVSGFKVWSASGTAFLALRDDGAQVDAVMWRRSVETLAFTPENGMQVFALVRQVGFYGKTGKLRVEIERLEPVGVGALARALEQLKARLTSEGLFETDRKRSIPRLPRAIGIATATQGAAVHDMLRILRQRFAQRRIVVRPCRVQGAGASADVARAIEDLNRVPEIEVIIVGRGGGSAEDLWAFNEEAAVRAIAGSRVPVVSAVGHEVDWTLADLAADLRAPTPTAAAQMVLPERLGLERELDEASLRLRAGLGRALERAHGRLRAGIGVLAQPRGLVAERRLALDALGRRAFEALRQLTPRRRSSIEASALRLRSMLPPVATLGERLDRAGERMHAALQARHARTRGEIAERQGQLAALSPLAVLERGFAIARRMDGSIIRESAALVVGETVDLRFAHGEAQARVLGVTPGSGNGKDETRG